MTARASTDGHPLSGAFGQTEPGLAIRTLRKSTLAVTEILSRQGNGVLTGTVPNDDAYVAGAVRSTPDERRGARKATPRSDPSKDGRIVQWGAVRWGAGGLRFRELATPTTRPSRCS
jgi:hypothetical protein